jgi:putative heme-binding domain-containing protein
LGPGLVLTALADKRPEVRVNALRLAETRLADAAIRSKVLALADDPDARVQFQVACALTRLPAQESLLPLQRIAARHAGDSWFRAAVLASASENAGVWFQFAAGVEGPARVDFVRRVASIAGARKQDREIAALLRDAGAKDETVRGAALEGLADGLKQGSSGRLKLPAVQPVLLGMVGNAQGPAGKAAVRLASLLDLVPSPQLAVILAKASATAGNASAPVERREWAAGVLGLGSTQSIPLLARLLTPAEPHEVQVAAAAALGNMTSNEVTPVLLERWRGATGNVRDVLLGTFFSDQNRLPILLAAIQSGTVQAWALGPARTRQLLQHSDAAIRKQAQSILSDPVSDRKPVYEKYIAAIKAAGRPDRGKDVYEKNCAECHKVGDVGHELGPDLRSVTKRYKETLLADILMPNQNIESGYEEYLLDTTDGRQITGILAKETPTTLTLRRKKGDEDTVLRSTVKNLRSLSLSPMPEDLEKNISVNEMADLIAYIKALR